MSAITGSEGINKVFNPNGPFVPVVDSGAFRRLREKNLHELVSTIVGLKRQRRRKHGEKSIYLISCHLVYCCHAAMHDAAAAADASEPVVCIVHPAPPFPLLDQDLPQAS